jgi:hypothetical protein
MYPEPCIPSHVFLVGPPAALQPGVKVEDGPMRLAGSFIPPLHPPGHLGGRLSNSPLNWPGRPSLPWEVTEQPTPLGVWEPASRLCAGGTQQSQLACEEITLYSDGVKSFPILRWELL